MRSTLQSLLFTALAALPCSACALREGDCVNVGLYGVGVTVVDKNTRQTPAGVVVSITDGAYQETLRASGNSYIGAVERTGMYTVTVEAPGYVRWTRENVLVTRSGHCDTIKRTNLTSELQPTG